MNLLDFIYGWIFFTGMFWAVGNKNYGWMGNNNPQRFGWGLKSSEIKIWRT